MSDYKNDPPTIIEHTTVNPVIERTIIERDNWYTQPWMFALFIGAIAIIGLISYWTLNNPSTPPVVNNTTIERDAPGHRAQTISTPVIVNPPASSSPTINVNPAPSNNNSNPTPSGSTTSGGGSNTAPDNGNSNGTSNNGNGSNSNNGNNGSGDNATTGGGGN